LALRERELQALGKQTVEISKAAAEAGARIKVTELAWRSAIAAARLLPLWAPESTPALDTLNRELRELIDPRLDQLIEWVDFEDECTAAYGPPTVFEDIPVIVPERKECMEILRFARLSTGCFNAARRCAPPGTPSKR